jgi:hypothetical protein
MMIDEMENEGNEDDVVIHPTAPFKNHLGIGVLNCIVPKKAERRAGSFFTDSVVYLAFYVVSYLLSFAALSRVKSLNDDV